MPVIDQLTGNEVSGERWVPTASAGGDEVLVNLERYLYACHHVAGKTVLDAGCGSGLGSYLYSLSAKKVFAVDYSDEAHAYAARFPFIDGKVSFIKANLENIEDIKKLPQTDICVAIEFLEHIDDPAMFLENIRAEVLVFSVPLHSLAVSKHHKFAIKDEYDVKKLIDPFYNVGQYHVQNKRWIYGSGVRRNVPLR